VSEEAGCGVTSGSRVGTKGVAVGAGGGVSEGGIGSVAVAASSGVGIAAFGLRVTMMNGALYGAVGVAGEAEVEQAESRRQTAESRRRGARAR